MSFGLGPSIKDKMVKLLKIAKSKINGVVTGMFILDKDNADRPTVFNGTEWKGLSYDDETFDISTKTTDDLPEGNTNKYNIPISVRNINDIEEFKITDVVRFQGFLFDAANKKILASPTIMDTVFVDFVNGNDSTAQLEKRDSPFKTFEAAIDAIELTAISDWTIYLFNAGSISKLSNSKNLTIIYYGGGTLDFSDCTREDTATAGKNNGNLTITALRATIYHSKATSVTLQRGFGATGFLRVDAHTLSVGTYISGGFWSGDYNAGKCYLRCVNFINHTNSSVAIGFRGELTVTNKFTLAAEIPPNFRFIYQGQDKLVVNINHYEKLNPHIAYAFSDTGNWTLNLNKISGDGTFYLSQSMGGTYNLNIDNLIIEGNVELGLSVNSPSNCTINLSGFMTTDNKSIIGGKGSHTVNVNRFSGRILNFAGSNGVTYNITDSIIRVGTNLFVNASDKSINLYGHNTILCDTPSELISGNTNHITVHDRGTLKTNALTIGRNATLIKAAYTFSEKKNEIVVRSKYDLINKELDSSAIYVIDGDIALNSGESIVVPPGGLSVKGYSFDSSRLGSYGAKGHSIFKSGLYKPYVDRKGVYSIEVPNADNVSLFSSRYMYLPDTGYLDTKINITGANFNHFFLDAVTPPFSIGLWFMPDDQPQNGVLFGYGHTAFSTNGNLYVVVNNAGHLVVWARGTLQTIQENVDKTVPHYVEFKWTGSESKLFYDGLEITLITGTKNKYAHSSYGDNLIFGHTPKLIQTTDYFKGFIGKSLVYNRARTETESSNTWNNGNGQDYSQESQNDLLAFFEPKSEFTEQEILEGGSGNILLQNIAFTTTGDGAGVFDLIDKDGSHALEMISTNFEGCKKLGVLKNYRQGTGITIGLYGCEDGLELDGTWNGFKLTNTNTFSFGATGTIFKAGPNLIFNNRFYLEINVDLANTAFISDVSPNNFSDDKLFQVNTSMAKMAGVVDPIAATAQFFPNIGPENPRALFTDNIGLKNTSVKPYGIGSQNMVTATDDAAAATAGIAVGGAYIESSTGYLKTRTS